MKLRNASAITLMVASLIWGLIMPAFADPIDYLRIAPKKRRVVQDFVREMAFTLSMAQPVEATPEVTGKLSSEQRTNALKGTKLSISDSASETVLEDKNFICHFRQVWLDNCNYKSPRFLNALARNCPDLQLLSISQDVPLSRDSIKQLSTFRKLKSLQLECPAADPIMLASNLPKGLEYLRIEEEYPLIDLPMLQFLSVNYCHIDHEFLERLRAPNLERLDFSWVDMPEGSLRAIGQFQELRELQIYNSNMQSSELQYIQPFEYLNTTVHQIYLKKTPYWDNFLKEAEGCFKAGKLQDAIANYREIAFSRPSTRLYQRMARCYCRLGFKAQALKSCELAKSLDAKSVEIDLLRKKIQEIP